MVESGIAFAQHVVQLADKLKPCDDHQPTFSLELLDKRLSITENWKVANLFSRYKSEENRDGDEQLRPIEEHQFATFLRQFFGRRWWNVHGLLDCGRRGTHRLLSFGSRVMFGVREWNCVGTFRRWYATVRSWSEL